MKMTFSDFLQICYKYAEFKGDTKFKYEFVQHFPTLFMRSPEKDLNDNSDQKDEYYPFNASQSFLRKIFNGVEPVPVDDAAKINSKYESTQFADAVYNLPEEALSRLKIEFEERGAVFGDSDVGEVLEQQFHIIVSALAEGKNQIPQMDSPGIDMRGYPLDEINPAGVYLDKTAHKLVIGRERIDVSHIPFSDDIKPEEQKYIGALLVIYAEKTGLNEVSVEQLQQCHPLLYNDLHDQRSFFFDALSVYRCVRDAFTDGELEFQILKDEAYEGIREVYISEYNTGFERLNAVLSKITNTTFDRTKLSKFTRLIGNREKKGICHMLVEDGRITTWIVHI